ncbi:UNVERIFIED_CONTAM: hypothetical protein FKN15_054514 [Acipenser sinensis]
MGVQPGPIHKMEIKKPASNNSAEGGVRSSLYKGLIGELPDLSVLQEDMLVQCIYRDPNITPIIRNKADQFYFFGSMPNQTVGCQSPPPTTKEDPLGTTQAAACQSRAAVTPCDREKTVEQGRRDRDAAACSEQTVRPTPRSNTKPTPVQHHFLAQFELSAAEYGCTDCRKAMYLSQALDGLVLLDLSWEEMVNCTALTTALKWRFKECDSYLGLQEQLQCWRRAPGEKPGALATEVTRLAMDIQLLLMDSPGRLYLQPATTATATPGPPHWPTVAGGAPAHQPGHQSTVHPAQQRRVRSQPGHPHLALELGALLQAMSTQDPWAAGSRSGNVQQSPHRGPTQRRCYHHCQTGDPNSTAGEKGLHCPRSS